MAVFALRNIMITMHTLPWLLFLLLTHTQETMLYFIWHQWLWQSLLLMYCTGVSSQGGEGFACPCIRYCGMIFVVIVAILGLIVTLLAVYELMLLVHTHIETGIKGIVLSLLWSLPLSRVGWYLKRRYQRGAATDLGEGLVELITEEQHPSNVFDSNSDERPLPL